MIVCRALLVSLVTILVIASLAPAQTTTGALNGLVQDSSGAFIVGATVNAVNDGTNVTVSTTTNNAGIYSLPSLPPGKYHIQVSKAGFKTVIMSDVTLNVQDARAINFNLEVGATSETVTVHGAMPLINTESSGVGTVLGEHELNDTPLTNRNYTQMLHLSAGVTASLANAAEAGLNTQDVFVHGGSALDNNYQMDGAQVNNGATSLSGETMGFGGIPIPNPDAIQEFKIQTGQYDAASGRSLGANVNVVTKSGTNSFHGSVFEYFRNDVLNANDYFLNRNGQPRPPMKQNQFGFTFGGPIKRDKLFFFGSYQGTRQVNGLGYNSLRSFGLPPLTNDRSAAALGSLFAGQRGVYQTLFGNVGPAILPDGSNINPVALALLQFKLPNGSYYIPTPQTIINGLGTSTVSDPSHFSENQMIENIDYAISAKHMFSAHWFSSWDNEKLGYPNSTLISTINAVPGNGPSGTVQNYVLTTKLTSILANSMVNEGRFSYVQDAGKQISGAPLTAQQLGILSSSSEMPDILIPGLFQLGADLDDGFTTKSETFQAGDQIAWTSGKHSIRVGFEFDHMRTRADVSGLGRGALLIPSFADFLLGLPATCNCANPAEGQTGDPLSNVLLSISFSGVMPRTFLANDWSLFIQDDYKVHPQLTLNLGLRWDINGAFSEANGRLGNFEPAIAVAMPPAAGTYSGYLAPSNYPGVLPDGVTRNGNNSTGNGTPLTSFGPRVGLAWRPVAKSQKFVVHAGYGIFYDRNSTVSFLSTALGPPFSTLSELGGVADGLASLQQPYNPLPPPLSAYPLWPLRTPNSTLSQTVVAPNFDPPMIQQWSLNLQYETKGKVLLDVGYVGSHGTRIFEMTQFNEAQLASPQNPINGQTTNTLENVGMRVPVVGFTPDGLRGQENAGMSSYQGLETTVRILLGHGMQMQAAYTFSKTLNNQLTQFGAVQRVYGGNSQSTVNDGRGLAEFSRPQRLVVSYMYSFPNFHGGTAGLGKVLGGWQLSGVSSFQSGNPLTLMDSRAGSIYGAGATSVWYMPANFCLGAGNGSLATSGSVQSRLNSYINTAAVCAPPTIGDGFGYGNIARGALRGPDQNNWDISLAKITKVKWPTEVANIEFRAQFFNAFNHSQFANPAVDAGSPGFGVINATSVSPRLIQFALKYNF